MISIGSLCSSSGVTLSDSVLYPPAFNNVKNLGPVDIREIRIVQRASSLMVHSYLQGLKEVFIE